jgi:hypothetical protein
VKKEFIANLVALSMLALAVALAVASIWWPRLGVTSCALSLVVVAVGIFGACGWLSGIHQEAKFIADMLGHIGRFVGDEKLTEATDRALAAEARVKCWWPPAGFFH